MSVVDMFNW